MKCGVIYHFISLPPAFASQTATAATLDALGGKAGLSKGIFKPLWYQLTGTPPKS